MSMTESDLLSMKGEDMVDKMEFPKTMREFIDNHSFKDIEEVYTNGTELIPVFRVEQALEHYEKEIRNKSIDDFVNACKSNTLCQTFGLRQCDIDKIAEQLKEQYICEASADECEIRKQSYYILEK